MQFITSSLIALQILSATTFVVASPLTASQALTCKTLDGDAGTCVSATATCDGTPVEDGCSSGSICCVPTTADQNPDAGEGDEGVNVPDDVEESSLESRATCADKLYDAAHKQLGKKYVLGGGSCAGATKGGFDCSGLVLHAVCKANKKSLPHSAQLQYTSKKGKKIPRAKAVKGDAIFWATNGKCGSAVKHVGIVKTKTIFINAAHSGVPVREQKIWTSSGGLKICPYAVRFC